MIDIFLGPKQYIQREGLLGEAAKHLRPFGKRPLILADSLVLSIVRPLLEDPLVNAGFSPSFVLFGDECSLKEINRLAEIARTENADFIVGTGGGKVLDTSRCVANRLNFPFVTIPTSAATCSAASAAAVVYENGVRQETINGKGADLVLVDSGIIARAPGRLLASGMGDALAKWYEGKPVYDRMAEPDQATAAAMTLSTQVREIILRLGLEAMRDVDAGKNSPPVERIIETNLLSTGVIGSLGGSKFRIAVAHALLYGLTVMPQAHRQLHGEMVSWGILVQLCLEKNETELEILLPFFSKIGIPITLKALGMTNLEDPLFWEGLKRTCAKGSSVHFMPFPVDEKKLVAAILEADERAREWQ
jgi:glycerol dehydrogenase